MKPTPAKTVSERQAAYVASQKAAGLVLVRVWVPVGTENDIKGEAEKLRNAKPKRKAKR